LIILGERKVKVSVSIENESNREEKLKSKDNVNKKPIEKVNRRRTVEKDVEKVRIKKGRKKRKCSVVYKQMDEIRGSMR
jgi:hypothetical protein